MNIKKLLSIVLSLLICMFSFSAVSFAEGPGGGGTPPGGSGGGGANTMTYDYTGTLSGVVSADAESMTSSGEAITSTAADENALLAQNGGTLTVSQATVTKSGDDNDGDNCNFYGINSIALSVGEGSVLSVSDSYMKAAGAGSNGVFATDSGVAYVYNVEIDTDSDNSRGLDATYSGTIVADSVTISTDGDHCAAVATDRGGGEVSVTNSSFSTAGSGSPLIYSTGDIEVDNVTGTATGSQIAGMEGLNTVLIYNSDLVSTLTTSTGSDPIADGIIIYQSTSGDAESTTGDTATFQAVNSKLTSSIASGAMFYVTNTAASIILKDTEVNFDSDAAKLFLISGNDSNNWGSAGSNGGIVTFTAIGETLSGDIEVDTISSLDMYLVEGSVYTGAMTITENSVNTAATDAPITVNIDGTSEWIVTADTTITNLYAADGAKITDANGDTVSVVADGETVVSGNSAVTVTVTGTYGNEFTTGDANELAESFIDRTSFDETFGITTTFSTNGSETASDDTDDETTEDTSSDVTEAEETEEAEAPESTETAAAEENDDSSTDSKAALTIIAIAAVCAVITAIVYLIRKRKA